MSAGRPPLTVQPMNPQLVNFSMQRDMANRSNMNNMNTMNDMNDMSDINNMNTSMSNSPTGNNSTNSNSKESRVKRKRNRIPLSCTICRKRKVKCDKIRPHCNQCTKTGVAHLCHYMEQSWAEEAEKELSKETELKNLRERVKYLEKTLSKIHSSSNSNTVANTPDNINSPSSNHSSNIILSDTRSSYDTHDTLNSMNLNKNNNNNGNNTGITIGNHPSNNNPKDKYDNDELDLTKQFNILHIKNNGTIHLGATHWLAIMKGDPYLKLLWGHIFNIRERVNDWYSQRMVVQKQSNKFQNLPANMNKCPVDYKKLMGTQDSNTQPTTATATDINNGIPAPHPLPVGSDGDIKKCPVAHRFVDVKPKKKKESVQQNVPIAPHPLPVGSSGDIKKCPVAHRMRDIAVKDDDVDEITTDSNLPNYYIKRTEDDKSKTGNDSLPSFQKLTSKCPVDHANNENKPMGTTKGDFMTYDQITAKVTSLLPPRSIIFLFVDKFFKYIYPIIPILDEQNFKNHLNRILIKTNDDKIELKMTKSSDYCNLGIMIIILRLTWLSLPANRCEINLGDTKLTNSYLASHLNINTSSNNKEDSLLIKYETTMELLDLVKDSLIKFDKISSISNNNINLTTIQFAIFYKVYMMNSPTEGFANKRNGNSFHSISDPNSHDSELNQILLSSIIQMAFSCGLHRDPDNFPQLNVISTYGQNSTAQATNSGNGQGNNSNNNNPNSSSSSSDGTSSGKEKQVTTERFKHIWRKIWFYIVHLDVEQSLTLGTPRLLRNLKDFSDTKLPSASKIDYIRDIKELIIIKNFSLFWQIDLVIISVLNNLLNVFSAKNVRKFELDELIQSLSNLTYGKKSINEILNDLTNNGLLTTSEGSINFQDYTDESYGLPSLEEIISSTATPIHGSSSSTPSSCANSPISTSMASPAGSLPGKKHPSTAGEKKFELPHESTTKAIFFSQHITLRMLLYLLNYILFTHYEPLGGQDSGTIALTKNYAQQTLNFAMDGYRNCLIFFNNVKRDKLANSHSTIFDYVNILLTPHCLDIGHRALQFLVCLTLRSKCGPIGGMKENIFSNNSSGGEDSDNESHTSDSSSNYGSIRDPLELSSNMINDIALDSVVDFQLANILISRMKLFQKLTKQISVQYPYAGRTSRSTGFFITLLSSSRKGGFNLTTWKHPKITGFFKNVPSLIMSGSTDQLKRCPVYQDALGFMGPRAPSSPQSTQLPPIRSSYKPITYTNSNIRKLEQAEKDAGEKRRKLNNTVVTPALNSGKTLSSGLSSTNLSPPGTQMQNVIMNSAKGPVSYNNNNSNTVNSSGLDSPVQGMNMQPIGGQNINAGSPNGVPLPPVSNFLQDGNNVPTMRNNVIGMNNLGIANSNLTPNSDDFFVQNSNFGELFDPNSVIAAINEFNPVSDMGGSNVGELDNFIQNGPNNMNVSSQNINLRANLNMQANGMGMLGNIPQGMNNSGQYGNGYNPAMATMYDNMAGMPVSNIVGLGGVNDVGYVPKIEDGFTELQDFTIWD